MIGRYCILKKKMYLILSGIQDIVYDKIITIII